MNNHTHTFNIFGRIVKYIKEHFDGGRSVEISMFTLDDFFCEGSKLALNWEDEDRLKEFLEYLEKYTDYTWASGCSPTSYPVDRVYLYGYSWDTVGLCQGDISSGYNIITMFDFVEFKPQFNIGQFEKFLME